MDKAPKDRFGKMQFLRAELYKHFIAVGQGKPTDVNADRVRAADVQRAERQGNPYELTASEALLARWAGVPARIGFGYYNGTPKPGGVIEFRPTNAATYLEVYFAALRLGADRRYAAAGPAEPVEQPAQQRPATSSRPLSSASTSTCRSGRPTGSRSTLRALLPAACAAPRSSASVCCSSCIRSC